MNTYRGSTIGAPSKATASTLCQKCLKRGHYSYECKAVAQERPYVSRPSRTQQLFNPKLIPKLTSEVPQGLPGSKGKPDELLLSKQLEGDRGRKRDRDSHDLERPSQSKKLRSTSSGSSVSVSTVSTDASRSPRSRIDRSPDQRTRRKSSPVFHGVQAHLSQKQNERTSGIYGSKSDADHQSGRGRRPSMSWSRDSYSSLSRSRSRSPKRNELRNAQNTSRRRTDRARSSNRTPRRQRAYSQKRDDEPMRNRVRTEYIDTVNRMDVGQAEEFNGRNEVRSRRQNQAEPARRVRSRSPRKIREERSLSPFSQRVALTKAMNMGR